MIYCNSLPAWCEVNELVYFHFVLYIIYFVSDCLLPALDEATQSPIPRIASRMRVHDAFIVRYDAENAQSLSLPEHCDTSAVSVVVALNSATDGDYSGGGTWFEALAEKGIMVAFTLNSVKFAQCHTSAHFFYVYIISFMPWC